MPATLQTPMSPTNAIASYASVHMQYVSTQAEIVLVGEGRDANNAAVEPRTVVKMTPAAFFTAVQGKTGTFGQRLEKVFLDAIGQAGTVA